MNTPDSKLRETSVVSARLAARNLAAPALRVLVLSSSYPSGVLPQVELWARRLVQSVTGFAEAKVVAPVPYVPALLDRSSRNNAQYKDVPRHRWDGKVEVFHPRLLTGPGQSLYGLEAASYACTVLPTVHRLRREFPFDVIHAHSSYPDGVAWVLLGHLYGIPVIITEHHPWLPRMRQLRLVRQQAVWAARECNAHIATSQAVRDHIGQFTGDPEKVSVIPNVIDPAVLAPTLHQRRNPDQNLWLGKQYAALVGPVLRSNLQARFAAALI
ncbi:MAG: glycosyltransferase [Chloroflexota bacterium]